MPAILLICAAVAALSADYRAPAGTRPAMRRPGAETVLPGGRLILPLGRHYHTGAGPFGLAVSPQGKTVATANLGPQRYSITVLHKDDRRWRVEHHEPRNADAVRETWRGVSIGIAFNSENDLYVAEGDSGRVLLLDARSGKIRRSYDLNRGGFRDSYTGDLALDRARGLLYVLDQANFRLVILDLRRRTLLSSVRVGRLPFAVALAPDGRRAYVTHVGMLDYRPIPGADPLRPKESGLPFPAFGFPSPEAFEGARRETEAGPVDVPGVGTPADAESCSLAVVNVENPSSPRVETFVKTGVPFGPSSLGCSSPSGVVATADRVYVSNAHNDSITVIDAKSNRLFAEILLRVPGLEHLRGLLPSGMAFHEPSGWLLVAEAGINAVGVIDTQSGRVLGHLPAAWFPTRVALDRDTVFVASAGGHGTGPNASLREPYRDTFQGLLRRGAISVFPLPGREELDGHTARVWRLNGFLPAREPPAALPEAIRHVVLIVKEDRSFDDVLGDITAASNGPVMAAPALARFGRRGYVYQERGTFAARLHLRNLNVTPNHHEMAARWAFSDNFYAASQTSAEGHHWLVGAYPNLWVATSSAAGFGGRKAFRFPTAAPGRLAFAGGAASLHPEGVPEAGSLWHHLERHGVSFRNYGEGLELAGVYAGPGLEPAGARYLTNAPLPEPLYRNTCRTYPPFNTDIPDQSRADRFIEDIEHRYRRGGEAFPRFIYIHLPNDHTARPRPGQGYPFEASYVADNDLALGRIVEYLSHSPWWQQMAVFITQDDAQGGRDHIDSHRSLLLLVSPYAKRNYVSRVNSSFPGLLKTVFRLLGIPPLNLFDAAASDLSDLFTEEPDFTPYRAVPPDAQVFDPAIVRSLTSAPPDSSR
ncbi:MAG TPA: bifunctional YncE family protein/alkaline phosphatase family protein [Bryobacteraceae bacterium]|nr:bifunctional YncE family protein/alkaline phosphatase family protein [Bryobacteraceae bacterium]